MDGGALAAPPLSFGPPRSATEPRTIMQSGPEASTVGCALVEAATTVRRGAAFMARGLSHPRAPPASDPMAERRRARLAGNALRELDRFLNLLIDAATEAAGGAARPDQANTAAKYRALAATGRQASEDHRRLLALGRSRACLFYCEGAVRRPDRRGGATMTAGWPDGRGRPLVLQLGQRLRPDHRALDDVARFYEALADRIAGTSG